jgi:hypothetical protein
MDSSSHTDAFYVVSYLLMGIKLSERPESWKGKQWSVEVVGQTLDVGGLETVLRATT